LAFRFAVASAGDQLISFMSLISIAGLVLGVAVLVVVLSVMNGFEEELQSRVLGVMPHGLIYDDQSGFEDWQSAIMRFSSHPSVLAAAPVAEGTAVAVAGGELVGITFSGILPKFEITVSDLPSYIVQGKLSALEDEGFQAVIGTSLAERLNVKMGDRITLVLPDARLTLAGPIPVTRSVTVAGLFEVGADADKSLVLLSMEAATRLLRSEDVAIRIKLVDLFEARSVLLDLMREMSADGIYAISWMGRHGNLYDAIAVQKSTMFLLLLLLIAVAAFNVVSNLVMTVNEKRAGIAILMTMGATRLGIAQIFVMHGVLVGAVGVTLGLVIGIISSIYIGDIYRVLEGVFGLDLMSEYFIHYLPSRVLITDVLTVAVVSLGVCVVATLYPAYRASTQQPVQILKYEG
tara:strand:+ start:5099 stop:6313 length:1215 start_codon:yes stop_codon:yes gene_type:complete